MPSFPMNRRFFLASSLALAGLAAGSLPTLATAGPVVPGRPVQTARQGMASVFQEMPFTGEAAGCDHYIPPRRLGRTADYLNALSEEERLRRHPFA